MIAQVDYTKTRRRNGILVCPKCGRKGEGSLPFLSKRDGLWHPAEIRHLTQEEIFGGFRCVKVLDSCWLELTAEQKAFNERTKAEREQAARMRHLQNYSDEELIAALKTRGYEVRK